MTELEANTLTMAENPQSLTYLLRLGGFAVLGLFPVFRGRLPFARVRVDKLVSALRLPRSSRDLVGGHGRCTSTLHR